MDDPRLLIEQLASVDYATRKRAANRLVDLCEPAIPPLIEALSSPRVMVRLRAAEALGRLRAEAALDPLTAMLEALPSHYDPDLEREVVLALIRIKTAATAPRIEHALGRFRETMANGNQFGLMPFDSAAVAHSGPQVALPDSVPALVRLLRHRDYAVRKAAGDRLAELGSDAFEPLCAEVAARHVLAVHRAVEALGRGGDPRAVEILADFKPGGDYDLALLRYEALGHLAECLSREPRVENLAALLRLGAVLHPAGETIPHVAALGLETARRAVVTLTLRLAADPAVEHIGPLARVVAAVRGGEAAIAAAQALETLARTHPCPQLRQAIKPLKRGLFHPGPPEFDVARRAIEAATVAWKDLPVTAPAPDIHPGDLPRPATEAPNHDHG